MNLGSFIGPKTTAFFYGEIQCTRLKLKTNLAVLITGQFREDEGWMNTRKNLGNTPHTVFISTWEKRGFKAKNSWIATKQVHWLLNWNIAAAFPEEFYGHGQLFKKVPNLENILARKFGIMESITKESLSHYSGFCDIENGDLFLPANPQLEKSGFDFNAERLLYKTARAARMMEIAEGKTGELFSHILRIRPDGYLDELIESKLNNAMHFDWQRLPDNSRPNLRLGDNIILGPRNIFLEFLTLALVKCRRYQLADSPNGDIHSILGEVVDSTQMAYNVCRNLFCNGGWPIDEFEVAVGDAVHNSPNDEVLAGFYRHLRANNMLSANEPALARAELENVPCSRRVSIPHIRTVIIAKNVIGDKEGIDSLVQTAEELYSKSSPAAIDNMDGVMAEIRRQIA